MKRTLVALAVAAAFTAPLTAQAAPKVYGKLNVSVEQISDDLKEDSRWEAVSNASRFGVKGEDEVTATISAVYGIEWEVTATGDDISGVTAGSKLDLTQRNRYVGLKHQSAGTIKFGKLDTYLKQAQAEVDLFNDLNADMGKVITGENRINNVIGYESPKIADLVQINVQFQPGEESVPKGTNTTNNPSADDNGLFDALSASIVLNSEEKGFYVALSADQNIVSTFNAFDSFNGAFSAYSSPAGGDQKTAKTDTLRLVGSYNLKDLGLTLNALYQQAERSEAITSVKYTPVLPAGTPATSFTATGITPKETSYLVSAAYKVPGVDGLVAKLQYVTAETEFDDTAEDVTLTQTSFGLDYNYTTKTKAFAYYSIREYENELNVDTGNGKAESYDVSFLGLGIEHKF